MYDPKFRFTIIVAFLVTGWWMFDVTSNYLFGEAGLNFALYFNGVAQIGGATLGGFIFVWVCVRFMTFQRYRKTGFEAEYVDEYGTVFAPFPVSLSKFVPDIIAAPLAPHLHPLECGLIGFLNGYRHFPYDATHPQGPSLYDQSVALWRITSGLEHADWRHRVVALAADLSKVYAIREVRKTAPLSQFWKRDKITYVRRCREHGGLAAFILSTLPEFRALEDAKLKRALLTALRYQHTILNMPINADPQAKDFITTLEEARLRQEEAAGRTDQAFAPTQADQTQLVQEVRRHLPAALDNLMFFTPRAAEQNSAPVPGDALFLGNGTMAVPGVVLLRQLTPSLAPALRNSFHLWRVTDSSHPALPYLAQALKASGLLVNRYQNTVPDTAVFTLRVGATVFPDCFILDFTAGRMTELALELNAQHTPVTQVEVVQDVSQLLSDMSQKAGALGQKLQLLYG